MNTSGPISSISNHQNSLLTLDPDREAAKIMAFIKATFTENGKEKALIALSGGVDSATSFKLAVKALSSQQVIILHLPANNTPGVNTKAVIAMIKEARIPENHFQIIKINGMIKKVWRRINQQTKTEDKPNPTLDRIRLGNLAARMRMMVIFDQAKKHNCLVIGTENKSERLLGYFTRYGDEASDLEPLTHLYKTQVYQLAEFLNVPQAMIALPPSADLWPGQSDEAELGLPYSQVDPLLAMIEEGKDTSSLSKKQLRQLTLVKKRVETNRFKSLTPYAVVK